MLWVCWEKPNVLPGKKDVVLSLLMPGMEAELKEQWPCCFICARERVAEVKQAALDTYREIISKIGTVALENGITLRQALQDKNGVSSWWFHKVACKDCESEPTFNSIIQILTIVRIAQEHQCTHLVVCGGRCEIVRVLRNLFTVDALKSKKQLSVFFYVFSLLRRVKFGIKFLYDLISLKRLVSAPADSAEILFSGFWDWSVKENPVSGRLEDRYFQVVPEKLRQRGLRAGWLVWFYNNYEANKPARPNPEVIKPLCRHPEVIVAQCLLNLKEVFYSLMRFRPFFVFREYERRDAFKEIFKRDGLDFYPLLKMWLYAGFLDGTIPYHELVCLAHQKAVRKYQPKAVVTFLNFFPYARAVYAGVKKGHPGSAVYDIQHASYSWEDTIGLLDADVEFEGIPDGCSVPHADYMCVMGELGRDIFTKSGFPHDRVLLTGSSRYDEASAVDARAMRHYGFKKHILIAASLDKKLELEMVDAVHTAFEQFPDVKLSLRPHPFSDIRGDRRFRYYEDRIRCSSGTSLDEDLADADAVIFSYSTVAEEAFIRGIPVWQWVTAGYNASVFRDIPVIPTFATVDGLIRLYAQFLEDPAKFLPTTEQRQFVKQRCFYAGEALPSDNIAEVLAAQYGTGEKRVVPGPQVLVES